MRSSRQNIEINSSADAVFRHSQDYQSRLDWDPFLKDLKFLSDESAPAIGVKVWVKSKNNMSMTVEYVSYNPPKHLAVKMIDGPFIFTTFAGVWTFREKASKITNVEFKYNFKLKFLFDLFIGKVVKWKLDRDMNKRLLALKEFCENESD
ncbi:MAG: SRPBCC family protein [Candidatus Heimdallarchaeota archaeon]|nr:SRPBCC family protein [Candidatus Heimdallarchaeota archaeon]